ncbi:MAG: hypothetical protein JRI36_01100, partial [Deltaproteobacteria bacterium]|nr:hypothetical protein [Deltaproteobacteria bacterium]
GSGGQVTYHRSLVFDNVEPSKPTVELIAGDVPLAGGISTVNLCINNYGYVDMDVVVARNGGQSPGDIYVSLINTEGLEISRAYFEGTPPGTMDSSGTWFVTVAPGDRQCVDVDILVPANLEAGSEITFLGVVDGTTYGLGATDLTSDEPLSGSMASGISFSPYYGTAQAGQDTYTGDETVVITGQAIHRSTGLAEPNVPLKLGFFVRGFKWYEDVMTDADGNFTFEYHPTVGLSGEFVTWAAHPDVVDTLDQDRFALYRLYAKPNYGQLHAAKAGALDFKIELHNPGDRTLTGFTGSFYAYTLDGDDNKVEENRVQGSMTFGDGYELKPGETRLVDLHFSADIDAPDHVNLEYTFTSAQGASDVLSIEATLTEAVPVLSVEFPLAGYVNISTAAGNMLSVPVTVKNTGLEVFQDAAITLPSNIAWMTVGLQKNGSGQAVLGDIGPGESVTFDVVFTPPEDTDPDYYHDKLVLSASNVTQAFEVNLWAKVTSSQTGDIVFRVVNFIGQEVEGASVRLQNVVFNEEAGPFETDANGEVTVTGLSEGEWRYRVTAAGHKTSGGVVEVKADQTVLEEVFPVKNLVTVSFVVEPVPFTDRYEIKIEQTFETHVPVPVLVVDPPEFTFNDVTSGFDSEIIFTATNHGLIKIENLQIGSAEIGGARLEPLISYVPELAPFQSMQIPCRVTYTEPESGLPGGAADKADKIDWLDCEFGGFKDITKGIVNLQTILKGRGYCRYTSQKEAEQLTNVATGMMVFVHLFNKKDTFKTGKDFFTNMFGCITERIVKAVTKGILNDDQNPQTKKKATHEHYEGLFGTGGVPGNGGHGGAGPANLTSWEGIVAAACFAEGTPVLMSDGGQRPIESVVAGDKVMAVDGTPATVIRTTVRESNHWREILYRVIGGKAHRDPVRRLRTTDEHPFWVMGREWITASGLNVGDILALSQDGFGEIISSRRFDVPVKVYNFDVEGAKSYFANGALVYQGCGGPRENDRVTVWLRNILKHWGDDGRFVLSGPAGDSPGPEPGKTIVPRVIPGADLARQRRPL